MEEILKQIKRSCRRHRIACYVFIAAIGILYITNFVMRAFVYGDGVLELLRDFVFPLAIVAGIYIVDWHKNYVCKLLLTHIPKVQMLAICAPIVAMLLSFIVYEPNADSVDFNITILAITSMYITPYALKNIQHTCIAIVVQTVVFILFAAHLGNNTAAMVTITVTAVMLISGLPKLSWFYRNEEYTVAKIVVALITLFAAILLLIPIAGTGIAEAFYISSLGRPGLGSSDAVNQQCTSMLANASFVGGTVIDYPVDSIFSNRVLTFILAQGGWVAVVPILLALVLVISSGIYVCRRKVSIQYYIAISFLTVMAVQIVGYLLMCAGCDALLFPELCPFLDGGCHVNTIFLLMAMCILPPKQKHVPNDFFDDDEDDEVRVKPNAEESNDQAYEDTSILLNELEE